MMPGIAQADPRLLSRDVLAADVAEVLGHVQLLVGVADVHELRELVEASNYLALAAVVLKRQPSHKWGPRHPTKLQAAIAELLAEGPHEVHTLLLGPSGHGGDQ